MFQFSRRGRGRASSERYLLTVSLLPGQSVSALQHGQTQEPVLLLGDSLLKLFKIILRYLRLYQVSFILHVQNIITN